MKAMVLEEIQTISKGHNPLKLKERPRPVPGKGELLIKISACGVCHTELDEIEGRTLPPDLPVIPGHQVVGRVRKLGEAADQFDIGDRVGVAWIFSSCGECRFCTTGEENLCPEFKATGRDADGGYAEWMTVPAGYAYWIPEGFTDVQAAPLLCAGAIGYRSLRLAGLGEKGNLGLTGFGGSGHLIMKLVEANFPKVEVYVFARSPGERAFARDLGAVWAGDTAEEAPVKLDAIIDTTPAWKPVVEALENLIPGGRLVINAIRKEAGDQDYLFKLDYSRHLWMEKEIKTVANVTRRDVDEFLKLAAGAGIEPEVQEFPLKEANQALLELKTGEIRGAKVLVMD
ncbi:MAG: zinc-dependent alcohol dehydrogenase family protein [Anaerolineales bacterium]|nr:zinc-dependent alcohol dehydrogenase family protein [Anaerolineales bacterium]